MLTASWIIKVLGKLEGAELDLLKNNWRRYATLKHDWVHCHTMQCDLHFKTYLKYLLDTLKSLAIQ